jgi:predicted nucleic acid-binding protein
MLGGCSLTRIILLDAGPIGMITHPRKNEEIKAWLQASFRSNLIVKVPEIADYEVRRELLRANKPKGIQRLNILRLTLGVLPITSEVMLRAAELWAQARQQGRPTADDKSLDADMILVAQALLIHEQGEDVVIATTNVAHLARFTSAKVWSEI